MLKNRTLNIGIGTRLQFQLGIKGQKCKAAGVLVGMVPYEYLMIRVPAIPGILSRLNEGEPIVVRYVYAGNVHGFSSAILNSIQKPALIVFLTYPSEVEAMNLRKAQRMECLLPASLKTDRGDYKAVIVDISLGGCRICFDYDAIESLTIDIDQTIGISFNLTGMAEEQVINCKIKNLKKDNPFCEMGVQFDQENKDVSNNVKRYIESFAELQFLPPVKAL
ncbi:MAG: flagellar brake protein [Syntrophobacteraceae bacterium]